MRFPVSLLIVFLCVAPRAAARQESVSSPGAVLEFTLSDEGGRPRYVVSRLGEPVIEQSQLGMVPGDNAFSPWTTITLPHH